MVRLPNEYQEVEYIESVNGAWIQKEISIITNETFRAEVKFQYLGDKTTGFWLAGDGAVRDGIQFEFGHHSASWYNATRGEYNVINGNFPNQVVEAYIFHTYTANNTLRFRICQRAGFDAETTNRRIWYTRLFINDEMIANFIPCYRKSDQEPGMYDTVTNTFFTNSGTGTFLVGNDVNYSTVNLMESRRRILLNTPHIKSLSGNALSFRTDVPFEMKECKVHFTPKQDLHGYFKPWPAGGGKNLFDTSGEYLANKYVNNNGEVVASSAGAQTNIYTTHISVVPGSTYTVSGVSDSNRYIRIIYYDEDDNFLGRSVSVGQANPILSFTPPEGTSYVLVNPDKQVSSIQLELGSTATAYEPYSNVCQITGWDGVTVTSCGKNLCPAANGFEIRDLEYYSQNRRYVITGLPPNTPMTLSVTVTKELGASGGRRLYLRGKTAAFINTGTIGQKSLTVNTNDDGEITISQNSAMINTDEYAEALQNIQLEFGSVATDYEPYTAQTLTIPFPQTIFGGYVDLIKGEVVETQTKVTLDGVTNKCNYGSYTGTYFYGAGWVYSNPLGLNYSQAPHDNFLCNKLPHIGPNGQTMHYSAVSSGKLYYVFRVLEKSDYPDGLTNTQVKDLTNAWLQENPVDVVYPLATPNTYPLTDPPSIPSTLRGLNNIISNANGEISVSFYSH